MDRIVITIIEEIKGMVDFQVWHMEEEETLQKENLNTLVWFFIFDFVFAC